MELGSLLAIYMIGFESIAKSKTGNPITVLTNYLWGLLKSEKKKATCTGMAYDLPDVGSQSLNHLLTDSVLDFQALMDAVAIRTSNFFFNVFCSTMDEVGLIIDEVGYKKQGKMSACVGRQWLGSIGKQDNGQVAVAAILVCRTLYSMVNMRLFMPEAWAADEKRREKAGIPKGLKLQTKLEIALEIIKKAITDGLRFDFVGFDALYGSSFGLLNELDKLRVKFMADIHSGINIYFKDPEPSVPEAKGRKGRKPTALKANAPHTTPKAYCESLKDSNWTLVTFRDGTKGDMQAWFHRKTVWIWDKEKDYAQKYVLVIRKGIDDGDIKYSLTNDHHASLKTNAFRQGQRYFVEKNFKEGKNQVGMGDYQIRTWDGFHRHMAICMLGLNFLMEQKDALAPILPYITSEKLRIMIVHFLPSISRTHEEQADWIVSEHDHYESDIKNNRRRAREKAAAAAR